MKNKYMQESGSSFDEASDIAIKLKVLAGEIYNAQVNIEWLKNQMFADTASGEYLDYIALQRGLERKTAVKSHGVLSFGIPNPVDRNTVIPKGCVVATGDSEPVRFCTVEDGVITAGNIFVDVKAEAEKAGRAGNVKKESVTVGVSVPSEIVVIKNAMPFSGGKQAETDIELRERIRKSFTNKPNGTNKAYYEMLALSVEGITKASAVPKVRGAGTVNIYVGSNAGDADRSAISRLQAIVDRERELNVDVQVFNADAVNYDLTVRVTPKSGYSNDEVREECIYAFEQFINLLPIGGKLYLSALGKVLLETGCIENYEYGTFMANKSISGSQRFKAGNAEVKIG